MGEYEDLKYKKSDILYKYTEDKKYRKIFINPSETEINLNYIYIDDFLTAQ